MKGIICIFKGHVRPKRQRVKDIKYAIEMYRLDVWGTDAFSNMDKIEKLKKELHACTRCGLPL